MKFKSNFEILRMNEVTMVDYFRSVLDNTSGAELFQSIVKTCGHTISIHSEKTDEELVENVLCKRTLASCFMSESYEYNEVDDKNIDYILSNVEIAIYESLPEICEWLKDRNNTTNKKGFTVDLGIPIGRYIDLKFDEFVTNNITVVLKRDYNSVGNFPFYVETAYPDFGKDKRKIKAERTGKNYLDLAKEVVKAVPNEFCRCYWELKFAGYNPHMINSEKENIMYGHFNVNGQDYSIKFQSYISTPSLYMKDEKGQWFKINNLENMSNKVNEEYNKLVEAFNTAKNRKVKKTTKQYYSKKSFKNNNETEIID